MPGQGTVASLSARIVGAVITAIAEVVDAAIAVSIPVHFVAAKVPSVDATVAVDVAPIVSTVTGIIIASIAAVTVPVVASVTAPIVKFAATPFLLNRGGLGVGGTAWI